MTNANKRVFISYTHDSDDHKAKVLQLADSLRVYGVDCFLDQYEPALKHGDGAGWMETQIREADFVLLVCSKQYIGAWEDTLPIDQRKGARWEILHVRNAVYAAGSKNDKFIPVLLSGHDVSHIPLMLTTSSHYVIADGKGFDELYWRLTGQHDKKPPPLGPVVQRDISHRLPVFESPIEKAQFGQTTTPSKGWNAGTVVRRSHADTRPNSQNRWIRLAVTTVVILISVVALWLFWRELATTRKTNSFNPESPSHLDRDLDKLPPYEFFWTLGASNQSGGGPGMIFAAQRLRLDAPDVLITGAAGPAGLDVDDKNTMYWAEEAAGVIRRARLDGSGEEVLVSGLTRPKGLAVDVSRDRLLWTENVNQEAKVRRASLQGLDVKSLVTSDLRTNGTIRLDRELGKLYITDALGSRIWRIDSDGSNKSAIVSGGQPWGLDFDFSERRVYWSDLLKDTIQSAKFDGSDQQVVVEFDDEFANPQAVAIDPVDKRIYFSVSRPALRIESMSLKGTDRRVEFTPTQAGEIRHILVTPKGVADQQSLGKPSPLAPLNGVSFSHFPRTLEFQWSAVPNAEHYALEVQIQDVHDSTWHPHPFGPEQHPVRGTSFTFEFVGSQPGRWRVQAISVDGVPGPTSDWQIFEFRDGEACPHPSSETTHTENMPRVDWIDRAASIQYGQNQWLKSSTVCRYSDISGICQRANKDLGARQPKWRVPSQDELIKLHELIRGGAIDLQDGTRIWSSAETRYFAQVLYYCKSGLPQFRQQSKSETAYLILVQELQESP